MISQLETRTLLDAELDGSTLVIEDTSSAAAYEIILITQTDTKYKVTFDQQEQVFSFRKSKVDAILVNAGPGSDTVTMDADIEVPATLNGGDGNDRLTGGAGDDLIDGGLGSSGTSNGNGGNDTLIGSTGSTSALHGGGGDDEMIGGANTFTSFEGGKGNDTMTGGSNTDTIYETANRDFVLTNTLFTGLGTDTLFSINSAYLTGGKSDNIIDCRTFSGFVTLFGKKGDDTLYGNPTGGAKLFGEAGNDSLVGGNGIYRDSFVGSTGDDTIVGGTGAVKDLLTEVGEGDFKLTNTKLIGMGTDTLNGVENVNLTSAAEDDRLDASEFTFGSVTLNGVEGKDTLLGGSSDDELTGGAGADVLKGGDGTDTIREQPKGDVTLKNTRMIGNKNDTLESIESANFYLESKPSGITTIDCSAFTEGPVSILASSNDAILIGTKWDDVLTGGGGVDKIYGGDGKDTINGGWEKDKMYGQGGDDTFTTQDTFPETIYGGPGNDIFSNKDPDDLMV